MTVEELFGKVAEQNRTQELFEAIVFDMQDQLHGAIQTDDPQDALAFYAILGWVKSSDQGSMPALLAFLLGIESMEQYLKEFLSIPPHSYEIQYTKATLDFPEA